MARCTPVAYRLALGPVLSAHMTTLDVLLPTGLEAIGPDPHEQRLRELYAYPQLDTPWVRANMVSTLDGAASGPDDSSGSINTAPDMRVFRVLRALADVVLVGAHTAIREGYARRELPAPLAAARQASGLGPLYLAVVTNSGQLSAELLSSPGLLVITTNNAPVVSQLQNQLGADKVIVTSGTRVNLHEAVTALALRGLRRVLCEGGPSLLAASLQDGILQEMCLTFSPLLVGGPAPRVAACNQWFDPAPAPKLIQLLASNGTLLSRWLFST